MRRKTVTTIETHEFWIIRRPFAGFPTTLCALCDSPMLTPHEAALRAGVSQRTIYRWVEEGLIDFVEAADGSVLVCLAPLLI